MNTRNGRKRSTSQPASRVNITNNIRQTLESLEKDDLTILSQDCLKSRLTFLAQMEKTLNDGMTMETINLELLQQSQKLLRLMKNTRAYLLETHSTISASSGNQDHLPPISTSIESASRKSMQELFECIAPPVKLPKLKDTIPTFDGNPLNWPYYRVRVVREIINNPELDDFRRQQYIHDGLDPKLRRLFSHIPLDRPDPKHILCLLDHKYSTSIEAGDKLLVIADEAGPITNSKDPIQWEKLADIANQLHNLSNKDDKVFRLQLTNTLAHKIPAADMKELYEGELEPDLHVLATFLMKKARGASRLSRSIGISKPKVSNFTSNFVSNPTRTRRFVDARNPSTLSISVANVAEPITEKGQGCLCCEMQDHLTIDCHQLTNQPNAEARREFLSKHRVCFRCISHRHSNSYKCSKQVKCDNCDKPGHLALLCFREPKMLNSSYSKNA